MTVTASALYRGAAATTSATLYTVPASTSAVVSDIQIANTAATAATATVALDGVVLLPAVSIPANSVASFSLRQVLAASKTVTGFASATTVSFHLSGWTVA